MKFLQDCFRLVLVTCLALTTLLAACGDSTNTPNNAPAATTTAASTTSTAATTAAGTTVAGGVTTAAGTTVAGTTVAGTTGAQATGNDQPYFSLSGNKVTINFWTLSLKGNKAFEDYFKGMIARYEKSRPNVKVIWNDYGWIPETSQKLLTAISANDVPDVVNMNTEMTLQYVANNAVEDMTKLIPQGASEVYFPGLFNATKQGSAVYNLPWYVTVPIIIYNKDLFQKAGLDPNKPPTTYEQVFDYGKVIRDKAGEYGYYPVNTLLEDLQVQGVKIVSDDGKKAAFNNDQTVAIYQRYIDLKRDRYVPADAFTERFTGAVNLFKAGKLAMMVAGASLLTQIQKDAPDVYKNIAVAPAPLGKAQVYPAGLMGMTVMKGSKNKPEATDFALYVTNDQNQLEFSSLPSVVILPSTKKAAADPFFTKGGDTPILQARKYMAEELDKSKDLYLALPNFGKLQKSMDDNFNSALNGQKSAKQAVEDTAKEWDAILAG